MLITSVIGLLLSAAIIGGGFFWIKRQVRSGASGQQDEVLKEIAKQNTIVNGLISRKDQLFSKVAADDLQSKVAALDEQITKEKEHLKAIEAKLEIAQGGVDQKEQDQQETKAAKEEDLTKLQELLVNYETIENSSVDLEHKLASSLKSIDSILSEVTLTAPQKEVLQSLSNAVTEAGARLRDLIMEAQTVNERLNGLTAQHKELEDEYTRLVEQQLGE